MAEDRKFAFIDGRFVNRVSGEAIPDDEPVIIFRARDKWSVDVLTYYLACAQDDHHRQAIRDRITEFTAYRAAHPDRVKEPGITRHIALNEPTSPPVYWSPEDKAAFAELPPHLQERIAAYERNRDDATARVIQEAAEARNRAAAEAERLRASARAAEDEPETCMACGEVLVDGVIVLDDFNNGGTLHATCCGPERESYTNSAGEPLEPDDPIPTGYPYCAADRIEGALLPGVCSECGAGEGQHHFIGCIVATPAPEGPSDE